MADYITRYDKMPIPPVRTHTAFFQAGVIRIGVEYRILTPEIAAAQRPHLQAAAGTDDVVVEELADCGVSLHIFGVTQEEEREYLRFDCFTEDPHYHYVNWDASTNEVLHLDPVAQGDPLQWALQAIATRLPHLLRRAGADQVAGQVDPVLLGAILPRVAEAAYRARYQDSRDVPEGATAPLESIQTNPIDQEAL